MLWVTLLLFVGLHWSAAQNLGPFAANSAESRNLVAQYGNLQFNALDVFNWRVRRLSWTAAKKMNENTAGNNWYVPVKIEMATEAQLPQQQGTSNQLRMILGRSSRSKTQVRLLDDLVSLWTWGNISCISRLGL